eukprot:2861620-Rhodomonas_salina.2
MLETGLAWCASCLCFRSAVSETHFANAATDDSMLMPSHSMFARLQVTFFPSRTIVLPIHYAMSSITGTLVLHSVPRIRDGAPSTDVVPPSLVSA